MRTRQPLPHPHERYYANQCSQCSEIVADANDPSVTGYVVGEWQPYPPQVPTVRPKFHSLPHTLKAMVWLVYIVFTVECVAWCVRWIYHGLT